MASIAWLERLGPSEEELHRELGGVLVEGTTPFSDNKMRGQRIKLLKVPSKAVLEGQVFKYSVVLGSLQTSLSHHQMPHW